MFHQFHLPFERRVEVILDMVVGPAGKELCNLRPPISEFLVELDYQNIFVVCPLVLLYVGV
jgi:hypothetical protein